MDRAERAETGAVAVYRSSPGVERSFRSKCGAGLFYRRKKLIPGCVDVLAGTFDDVEAFAPTEALQVAEAPSWMETIKNLERRWRCAPGGVELATYRERSARV